MPRNNEDMLMEEEKGICPYCKMEYDLKWYKSKKKCSECGRMFLRPEAPKPEKKTDDIQDQNKAVRASTPPVKSGTDTAASKILSSPKPVASKYRQVTQNKLPTENMGLTKANATASITAPSYKVKEENVNTYSEEAIYYKTPSSKEPEPIKETPPPVITNTDTSLDRESLFADDDEWEEVILTPEPSINEEQSNAMDISSLVPGAQPVKEDVEKIILPQMEGHSLSKSLQESFADRTNSNVPLEQEKYETLIEDKEEETPSGISPANWLKEQLDNNAKKNDASEEREVDESLYDSNKDGYYDDVKPLVQATEDRISPYTIFKIVGILVGLFLLTAFLIMYA